jgi:hydroxylysine kinase
VTLDPDVAKTRSSIWWMVCGCGLSMNRTANAMDDRALFMATMVKNGTSVALEQAEQFVREHYGIDARAERLTGERDENFHMRVENGAGYVLKVSNPAESPSVADLQIAVLLHLERTNPDIPVPRVRRSRGGQTGVNFNDRGAARSAVLYTFLPGKTLISATRSTSQRSACGRLLARMGRALRDFEHPASRRALVWDLRQLPRLSSLLPEVPTLENRAFIADFIARFEAVILPRLEAVRRQFIHNDFNARNIIVDSSDESRVTGIIDFGDSVHTGLIADVAVGVMGQLTTPETADEAIRDFVRAYCEIEPLDTEELALIDWLIAGRIVQNVVITSWHRARNPTDRHFDAFGTAYFAWRVELAKRLVN